MLAIALNTFIFAIPVVALSSAWYVRNRASNETAAVSASIIALMLTAVVFIHNPFASNFSSQVVVTIGSAGFAGAVMFVGIAAPRLCRVVYAPLLLTLLVGVGAFRINDTAIAEYAAGATFIAAPTASAESPPATVTIAHTEDVPAPDPLSCSELAEEARRALVHHVVTRTELGPTFTVTPGGLYETGIVLGLDTSCSDADFAAFLQLDLTQHNPKAFLTAEPIGTT